MCCLAAEVLHVWWSRLWGDGLVSVGRWSCSRGASCGVHYGEVEGLVSVERWSCSRGAVCGGVDYGEVEWLVN